MIALDAYRGSRALVLGYGRTGAATADALLAGGAAVSVWDDSPEARRIAAGDGRAVVAADAADAAGTSLVAVSPGVPSLGPRSHPLVAAARSAGAVVDNDVGLFFEWLAAQRGRPVPSVIGVTGTNGKSTTTALIAHLLSENGIRACAAGNIGVPVLALDPDLPWEAVVLELSSFQLEAARILAPDVAVLLNLEADHLDRHGTFRQYSAAKERLFALGPGKRHFVVGVEDEPGYCLAQRISALAGPDRAFPELSLEVFGEEIPASRFSSGCSLSNASFVHHVSGTTIGLYAAADTPALRGAHNRRNEAAAFLVAARFVADASGLCRALASFPGLPHRLERLGVRAGVEFVNDSKATNPASAARALAAASRIRWIAGGRPKPGGFASLRPLLGRVRSTYLIGEGAAAIAEALGSEVPHRQCIDLSSAFVRAVADAEPGDTVLLSPACASFDQFPDFEARGEAFRRLFLQWAECGENESALPEAC